MNSNVIPRPGDDRAYQQREAEFEALLRELAEKELELATLENELAAFEKKYARRVGVLLAELDMLDQEIAAELYRLHPQESYRRGFEEARWRARSSHQAVDEEKRSEAKQPFIPSEELKNLYRRVAKAVHPDLATDENERAYRTRLMARANAAYREGDMEALEQILDEWEHRDETSFLAAEGPDLLGQLEQKIHQVRLRLAEIARKIAELKRSERHQLMTRVQRAEQEGRDLLGEMAEDLRGQIRAATELLSSLKAQEKG